MFGRECVSEFFNSFLHLSPMDICLGHGLVKAFKICPR